jgi:RNA polymerase sigma-70 factor (ECF subfamily)
MTAQPGFEQADREFGPMIRRIALTYEADRDLAEELIQDIRFALWRALPGFRGQSSIRTFVARLATNRAITHVKKRARLPRLLELSEDIPAFEPGPEDRAIARDRQANLISAVRSLPLSLRQVALLTLEGLPTAEIADVLGTTANAVAIRLSRAKEVLRKQLGAGQ